MAAFLSHFGSYLPSRAVTNAEIAGLARRDPGWIRSTSGIEERRFAAPDETVADLAVAAARASLDTTQQPPLGMVLVASGSSDRQFPGPAAAVARALNLGTIPAVDLPMASAGALFGVALASQLCTRYDGVLVIAAEKMSSVVARQGTDPTAAMLFGDGAGACVVSRRGGMASIVDSALYSDGQFEDALRLGFTEPLRMDGRTIIMQAARRLPEAIASLLDNNGIAREHVDAYLLHQANQNLIDQVARTLGVPVARFFTNIRRYGNTSSASMLIALAEWSAAAGFRPNVPVVLSAFGAGVHWGAMLLTGVESR